MKDTASSSSFFFFFQKSPTRLLNIHIFKMEITKISLLLRMKIYTVNEELLISQIITLQRL